MSWRNSVTILALLANHPSSCITVDIVLYLVDFGGATWFVLVLSDYLQFLASSTFVSLVDIASLTVPCLTVAIARSSPYVD